MRFFFLVLCVYATNVSALQSDPSYYPQEFIEQMRLELRDDTLKTELFRLLTSAHQKQDDGHDRLTETCATQQTCYAFDRATYNQARRILWGQLHATRNAKGQLAVKDVYCGTLIRVDKTEELPNPDIGNTEHTWPQSKFSKRFSKDTQKADLHILFPVLSAANSLRSNWEFGDVASEVHSVCPVSRLGFPARGDKDRVFEPPAEHKGNVARAIFYFSVRYKMSVSEDQEASLRAWNNQDPVDDFERARNEKIFEHQHDRNPFVDYPQLIDRISDF